MKRAIFLALFVSFALFAILGLASAAVDCDPAATTVGGTIYVGDNLGNTVSNANVEVTCHDSINGDVMLNATSNSFGNYKVVFNQGAGYCAYGSNVTVDAFKNALTGQNDGKVSKHFAVGCLDLSVGVVNVPLIPEFGLMLGGLINIVEGVIRYWSQMNEYLRFIILGILLIVLIWISYKKLKK